MGMTLKSALEYLKDFDSYTPYQEAINKVSDWIELFQVNYEARLKADMVAMLTEVQLEIEELQGKYSPYYDEASQHTSELIQQKINKLKENRVMQLVIDIPDHQYNDIMAFSSVNLGRVPYKDIIAYAINAIKHGTPLPKGHGRLIDADRLKEEMEKDVRRAMSFVDLTDFVWLAPTIIEADEEGNHE